LATKAPNGFIGSVRACTRQTALADMGKDERARALNAAIERSDDLTLCAVLAEPSFVSGTSDAE